MSKKYYSGWTAALTDGQMEKLVIEPASSLGAGTRAELGNNFDFKVKVILGMKLLVQMAS